MMNRKIFCKSAPWSFGRRKGHSCRVPVDKRFISSRAHCMVRPTPLGVTRRARRRCDLSPSYSGHVLYAQHWSDRQLLHSRLKTLLFCKSFPPLCFIFVYNCGLTVRNKRICNVMLCLPFFFMTDHVDSPDCLLYFWAYPFLLFSFFLFYIFQLSVPRGRLSWLVSAFERTLK